LTFSPTSNLLVATSWSGQVLCWDVQVAPQTNPAVPSIQALPKAAIALEKPALCSAWSSDGSAVFVGGADGAVRMWSLATNQQQQVAQHAAPVRHAFFVPQLNMLVTGSWDKTIKYWDLRSPNPTHTQQLPERVYAMDCSHPMLVVGTADRTLQVYNLSSPQQPYKQLPSPLKYQTRCVAAFPDATGYLVGSVEGRVAVQHVEESVAATKNFTFKCHRDGNEVYSVNSMAFHPQYHTFVTAGSDGAFNFWDKDSKQRLKAMAKCSAPIPCGAFNREGNAYAYAVSYDWSRGFQEHNPATAKNYIYLHQLKEDEVKSRGRAPGRR
jgi:mRNA export factor